MVTRRFSSRNGAVVSGSALFFLQIRMRIPGKWRKLLNVPGMRKYTGDWSRPTWWFDSRLPKHKPVADMGLRRFLLLLLGVSLATQSVCIAQPTRRLAPGVLTTIQPEPLAEETFTGPIKIVALTGGDLAWTPNYSPKTNNLVERANRSVLRRDVWNLEFSFKPLRMIAVDMPQPDGKLAPKIVWYMVYRIRYHGQDIRPAGRKDEYGNVTFPSIERFSRGDRRFMPNFVLDAVEFDKSYLDRIIPAAKPVIAAREKVGRPLYNSVEMTEQTLERWTSEKDTSVWGVVTWVDLDPRIDFFSIYIRGLTNAFRVADAELGDNPNVLGKTLRLNFWRPGDAIRQLDDEIRFGVPIKAEVEGQVKILNRYGLEERLDHLWVYR